MQYRVVAIASVLVLIGAGCAGSTPTSDVPGKVPVAQQMGGNAAAGAAEADAGHGADAEHLAVAAGSRIALDNKSGLKPGDVALRFKLYGLDGHEFGPNDLKITHEKKMHFLLVRDDMTGFQHLHPEYADGKWTVSAKVSEAGQYQMYVDIEPEEEKPVVLRVPLAIGSPTPSKAFPEPNADRSAMNGNYRAALAIDGALRTNQETRLTFALTEEGKPVADIDPYLGAFGHVVLLRHNDVDDFFHVHPVTESKPTDGRVEFDATFPSKGRYTLYAQFKIKGEVRTLPITVDVNDVGGSGGAMPGSHN